MSLDFSILRHANELRLPQFKDRQGNRAHDSPDGSDWTAADWAVAALGEAGELCSELKKARRGDYGYEVKRCMREQDYKNLDPVVKAKILKEVADVIIYLDIFTKQFGEDTGRVVISKFNEVSERVGADVFITESGTGVTNRP